MELHQDCYGFLSELFYKADNLQGASPFHVIECGLRCLGPGLCYF